MHPDRIGPYLISRKIGAGGMGNVYHGTHEESGDEVAVKVLPASMAREEGFVHRFSREIDALRKVSSPNIVQIFQDGQTEDGSYYFSMEYVDGETLTSVVSRRRKIPWQEVIGITLQICTALKAAHDAGIVHRDLKPSNLMIAQDGTVKLADFGVAHVFASTRLTRTGGVVGTAEYMSPEQARGQRATKLSDLYSLGAVMYVMLTGRPPFSGQTPADILHKHQYGQFDRPGHYVPDIPRQLEEFVCKLLEKRPENRLPDAFVVLRQLANIQSRLEYSEKARAEEMSTSAGGSDLTAGLASARTASSQSEHLDMSRGPATMVRDAIREDLESQLRKSPVARFFDNTFVLIGLLALVIAAGYYLSRTTEPDPAELLAEAREILDGKPGRSWLRARDDLLTPLLDHEDMDASQQDIQQLIRQVDQFEFCESLQTGAFTDGTATSELHRLIVRAFETYATGEVADARQQIEDVSQLLSSRDKYLQEFLQSTIATWNQDQWIKGRQDLLTSILSDAREGLREQTEIAEHVRRLSAAISLYADDDAVWMEVEDCQQLLRQLQATPVEAEVR